ncbi:MAG: glycosyltransferase, partial [Chloroflexota bacterium]
MVIGVDASRAVTKQRTGTEAYAYFLIRELIPLAAEQNCRLRLYFNQAPPPALFPQADHVEQVNIPFPRLWTHVRLGWELARRPPEVFYTPAHVIPYGSRVPSVATIHDLGFHFFPEAHTRSQRMYLRWSTRHNGQQSQRVIVDSQATKKDLIDIYHINPAKIDVIYPGFDPDLCPISDVDRISAVQKKYGLIPPY